MLLKKKRRPQKQLKQSIPDTCSWVLQWSKVAAASWFSLPKIMPVKFVFDARAIFPAAIVAIILNIALKKDPDEPQAEPLWDWQILPAHE